MYILELSIAVIMKKIKTYFKQKKKLNNGKDHGMKKILQRQCLFWGRFFRLIYTEKKKAKKKKKKKKKKN